MISLSIIRFKICSYLTVYHGLFACYELFYKYLWIAITTTIVFDMRKIGRLCQSIFLLSFQRFGFALVRYFLATTSLVQRTRIVKKIKKKVLCKDTVRRLIDDLYAIYFSKCLQEALISSDF